MTRHELKQTRKNLGLSVKEAAKTFKVSYSGWGKWERGERKIPGLLTVALDLYKKAGNHESVSRS